MCLFVLRMATVSIATYQYRIAFRERERSELSKTNSLMKLLKDTFKSYRKLKQQRACGFSITSHGRRAQEADKASAHRI